MEIVLIRLMTLKHTHAQTRVMYFFPLRGAGLQRGSFTWKFTPRQPRIHLLFSLLEEEINDDVQAIFVFLSFFCAFM